MVMCSYIIKILKCFIYIISTVAFIFIIFFLYNWNRKYFDSECMTLQKRISVGLIISVRKKCLFQTKLLFSNMYFRCMSNKSCLFWNKWICIHFPLDVFGGTYITEHNKDFFSDYFLLYMLQFPFKSYFFIQ